MKVLGKRLTSTHIHSNKLLRSVVHHSAAERNNVARPLVRLHHSRYDCALTIIIGSFVAFTNPVELIMISICGAPALTAEDDYVTK